MQQQTEEWYAARVGRVTASRVADILAKTKSGPSASRANYLAQLICERLTGNREEGFESSAMVWGRETEPQARAAYEFVTDNAVTETGFVLHPTIADFGASPDGLVSEMGLVEIKCPSTATHLETLLDEVIPGKYLTQMQAQMACTGREWCDFVSFDPRLPADLQLWVKRVDRDAAFIAQMEAEIVDFLGELEGKINALRGKFMRDAA